jgi:D-3-phosphoglycerate dehydrogenase
MSLRVGITTSSFAQADATPLTRLHSSGLEVISNPFGRRLSRDEAFEFVSDLDGLIAGLEPLDRGVLGNAPSLKALARVGIGMDNVDQEAAAEFGIALSNTPEPPSIAVAELTMTAMLCMLRDFRSATTSMQAGKWEKRIQSSLDGATVLIVGLGRIGRRVASLAEAFGAECIGIDPNLRPDQVPTCVQMVPLEVGLERADVITIHASGSEPIIGARELSRVREGVILLNASRGALVDESALAMGLESGRVGWAWFDAFWEEPYEGSLLGHPRFLATPHIATYTARCRSAMEMEAVDNLLRDLHVT